MSDEKNTGLFHDDDGNIDDRRIAAWVLMLGILVLGFFAVHRKVEFATAIFSAGVWASVTLFGATVAEKFRK